MHTGLVIAWLIIIFIIWTCVEQKLLVTTKYEAVSDKVPKAFDSTSFVLLSDLHNYNFGNDNDRLVRKIEALSPDFIIIAGDMINKRLTCYPSNAFSLIEQLAKRYKIYYAYGNHEQWMENLKLEDDKAEYQEIYASWLKYKEVLEQRKITFLNNESIVIDKNNSKLRITGINIDRKFFEHGKMPRMEDNYIESLVDKKPEGVYELLIAHNPVYFVDYNKWGADLTLSGHLHGGLVRLPGVGGMVSPQVWLFPKYNSGNFNENGQQMIVSRGLGSHSMMPRMFNIPEIVTVTLKNDIKRR